MPIATVKCDRAYPSLNSSMPSQYVQAASAIANKVNSLIDGCDVKTTKSVYIAKKAIVKI